MSMVQPRMVLREATITFFGLLCGGDWLLAWRGIRWPGSEDSIDGAEDVIDELCLRHGGRLIHADDIVNIDKISRGLTLNYSPYFGGHNVINGNQVAPSEGGKERIVLSELRIVGGRENPNKGRQHPMIVVPESQEDTETSENVPRSENGITNVCAVGIEPERGHGVT
jgi:hypothetical protein